MSKTIYICQECGHKESKWMGRCSHCQMWNTFEETLQESSKSSLKGRRKTGQKTSSPLRISEIEESKNFRIRTGISEIDRVMGGGLTIGSLSLIGGEPGIGKSTLLLHLSEKISQVFPDKKILYISGEESQAQVASRCRRLGIKEENLLILHETSWEEIIQILKVEKPVFMVLDSIQTTVSQNLASAPGSASQVREVTYELMNYSKAYRLTSFIIGHITKEGGIAGPKILEHMVDTVISFEGDQVNQYRILRVLKNRFGNTHEVGIFEMNSKGLEEVKNPSLYFIEDMAKDSFGSSLTCLLEGTRPILVEIQALAVENKFGNGRRTTQGYDSNRLSLLVAVIEKYLEIPITFNDIYLNIVGGLKVQSRESDLAVVASLLSSYYGKTLDSEMIFLGEVGLTGEVRSVPMIEQRLKEIALLNYKNVIIPESNLRKIQFEPKKLKLIGIKKISDLEKILDCPKA